MPKAYEQQDLTVRIQPVNAQTVFQQQHETGTEKPVLIRKWPLIPFLKSTPLFQRKEDTREAYGTSDSAQALRVAFSLDEKRFGSRLPTVTVSCHP